MFGKTQMEQVTPTNLLNGNVSATLWLCQACRVYSGFGHPKSAFCDTVQLRAAAISHCVTPSKLFMSEQNAVVVAEASGVTVQEIASCYLRSATESLRHVIKI